MPSTEEKESLKKDASKNPGFFSKLVLLGVLPLLYTLVLGMVILHFAGVKVQTQIKWVQDHTQPLIASILKSEEKEKTVAKAADKKDTADTAEKSQTVSDSPESVKDVSNPETVVAENGEENVQEVTAPPSVLTASLTNMDPNSAADLLSNMTEKDAINSLKKLEQDVQTAILEELPAEKAASWAVALEDGYQEANGTQSAVQLYQHMTPEQIALVLSGIKDQNEVLRQIKRLDPNTASQVITKLDPQTAGWIVSQMK
ncbi:magnesium transporter MgtE N-terminal domain-containing protein [Neobacillus muris]|uniref:magnesium transporter MgtE N-terminal domain-containing protein n=1 Tax=Neobacillus muris TaxID=2941334 RepID=UPI00203FDB7A|nr:hypothetical protein [Neobacillus muris]